jgi:CheY-like chemotaxis protein
MRSDLQTAFACDELTGDLQHALAALADVEFSYERRRERLSACAGLAADRDRLLEQLEVERQQCRAPLVRRLDELDRQMKSLVFPQCGDRPREIGVQAMTTASDGLPKVVVLVEEEADEREAISRLLRQEGFRVEAADTTDAALELMRADPYPCALVTDAHEPGEIDGWELAQRVRQLRPDAAVVLMSGHSDDTSWSLPDGAQFLHKPNVVTNLATTLHQMMGERWPAQA